MLYIVMVNLFQCAYLCLQRKKILVISCLAYFEFMGVTSLYIGNTTISPESLNWHIVLYKR